MSFLFYSINFMNNSFFYSSSPISYCCSTLISYAKVDVFCNLWPIDCEKLFRFTISCCFSVILVIITNAETIANLRINTICGKRQYLNYCRAGSIPQKIVQSRFESHNNWGCKWNFVLQHTIHRLVFNMFNFHR